MQQSLPTQIVRHGMSDVVSPIGSTQVLPDPRQSQASVNAERPIKPSNSTLQKVDAMMQLRNEDPIQFERAVQELVREARKEE